MKTEKSKYVFISLTIFMVIFIFFNSLQPAKVSSQISNGLLHSIYPIISKILFFIPQTNFAFVIRKLAHITEFSLLSIFLVNYFFSSKIPKISCIIYTMFFSLLTACIDEQIQLFINGRSSEVRDIFIDFSGVIIGILVSLLIKAIIDKRKKKKHRSRYSSEYFRRQFEN